ncbi:glycosyltransferase family 4 protein [Angustibacter luteus]|uniref:Glycosyltransferase family 4 protein n=1 Tax=Angustibacter luteus TaxID=658456 RepID=A0ABW1JHK8_9ACTN
MGTTVLVTHPGADLYGSDRVMVETVRGLLEQGARVVVTLPTPGPLTELLGELGVEVVFTPTPVLRKAYLSPTGLLRLLAATAAAVPAGMRLLRRVRPDVVYVSTITAPLWLVLARLVRADVVCHVHEAERSARPVVRRALVAPLLLAHRLVVNSQFSADVLADTFGRLERTSEVVYNGIPGPADVTPLRADVTDELRVLYVGRLSERKGVDVAVAAVGLLNQSGHRARLGIVGAVFPGYEWYEQQLGEQVARLALTDRVTFHGFSSDVWTLLAGADVLVVPSRLDEPFGNTAVEGVLAGRPVVASATSGLLEAVEGLKATRSVPPADPQALADALAELVGDWPQVLAQMPDDVAEAARRYSPRRYREHVARVVLGPVNRGGSGKPPRREQGGS